MFHIKILTTLCFVLLFIDFRVLGLIDNCNLGDSKLHYYYYKGQILKVEYEGDKLYIKKCETAVCPTEHCVTPPIFDVEKMLYGIRYLDVTRISQWPPLPSSNSLIFVYYDSIIPLGEFGPCLNLSMLRIFNMKQILSYNSTFGYLRNCTKIDELWINKTSISQIHIILKDAPDIKNLVLRYVDDFFLIEQYPLFTHRSSFNHLEYIGFMYFHNNIDNNSTLKTDWAQISAVLTWQLSLLPNLKKLEYFNFPVYNMCATNKSPTGNLINNTYCKLIATYNPANITYKIIPYYYSYVYIFIDSMSVLNVNIHLNVDGFNVADLSCTVQGADCAISERDPNIYSFKEQIIRAKITIGKSYNRLNIELCKTSIGCMKPCRPNVFDINKFLYNVPWLRVKSVEKWPPIPSLNSLKEVIYDSVSPSGEFGSSCLSLKTLTFRNMSQIHYNSTFGYLRNCTKLDELYIIETGTMQTHMILKDAPGVKSLTIRNMNDLFLIEQYPLFSNRSSNNYLESIYLNTIDNNNPLETDWAQVSAALTWQFSTLPKLWYLDIKQYFGYDMCVTNMLPAVFTSLTQLNLFSTNTTKVCFGNYLRTPQLKELYIKGSPYLNIEFRELITTRTPNLTVEVDNLQSFKFSRNDYLALASETRKGQITLKQLRNYPMECSCDHEQTLWLMRAMVEELVVAEEFLCRDDNKPLVDQTCDRLDCNRSACKSSSCVCCRVGTHEAVAAMCRDANLMALPDGILRLRNLTQLIVSNNRITSLPKKLPDALLRLDLSSNKIQYLNDAETMVLFDVPTRKVRLAGNPIVCSSKSCYNQPLLDALQFPKNQVEDNVECIGEAKTLSKLPEFCESKFSTQREIALVLMVILIVILAIIALLALYYRQSLKMYLFARGWCLWWLQEEELDEDRRFDVFLSFCHNDVQLVLEELLPELDRDFTVCVHLRDWVPGEMIPTQILRSVEQSRRTVVVVSNSYAKSLWGLLEFRTAYASGLSEGRSRVVMVILDDVLESQDLNGELKQYIRYHTYVRWGDPWFWSKLRYALPHNPLKSRQTAQTQQATGEVTPQILTLNGGPSQTDN